MWAGLDIQSRVHIKRFWRYRTHHHINLKETASLAILPEHVGQPRPLVGTLVALRSEALTLWLCASCALSFPRQLLLATTGEEDSTQRH